ncbi:heavy metal-binding domain-containing protein [Shewanella eurypsychrophilus]|uniref:Heavy metal-binding domain-containing protein n=1 Tax=Shewanella eurypsychrophilus TaxID=2593656 RepID=A0ABX6V1S8_9GAMM|nr:MULTISPECIES: heavy metal-binding domain-containing protein [Shewanella]QFU21283.1 heavy metal-binding domain-containing protein [Shewanella sp. YLB-09]QPG56574.1 heavy metal-binding domain-containing protein [Shewanella eurypsychrophilus]
MTKECMNCGYVTDDKLENTSKCVNCEVYFHKFESRAKKLADKLGLTLEEYFVKTKPEREAKKQELLLKKIRDEEFVQLTKEEDKKNEALKRIQRSDASLDLSGEEVNELINSVLVTTTDSIPNYVTQGTVGIASAESCFDKATLSDFFIAKNNSTKCLNPDVKRLLACSRSEALNELKLEAIRLKGNAVVGVKIEYIELENVMLVVATGTAISVEKSDNASSGNHTLRDGYIPGGVHGSLDAIGRIADLAYLSEVLDQESDGGAPESLSSSLSDL